MHSHLWCTKTLFTSFCRTDDSDRINNAIRQLKTMGNITARGFITRLYSATVPTDSFTEKSLLTVRINRRVRLHILSLTSFTSDMWIWIFFRAIFVHQCKRYPLLLSGPKGNNDFSHCSFIKNLPPPLCPLSHTGIKFMYIPLALTKAWTTRDAFLQFFFYYY